MTTYTPSSSPPLMHSPPSHATSFSTKHQQDPVTLTARKVDLELLRLKGLGKVTKKSDTEEQKKPILTNDALKWSTTVANGKQINGMDNHELNQRDSKEANQKQQLEECQQQLETSQRQLKDHEQQVHTLKEELNTLYQQQEQQLQQETVKYKTQLLQQEKLAQDTIANYIEKIESSQIDVRKLTLLVEKQDQLIELLMDEHEHRQRYDEHKQKQKPPENEVIAGWQSLHLEKQQLETAIGSLKANMETNQAHMQMMMMVSTEIQNDFERQKAIMEQELSEMADEMAAKDLLLQHYQAQQQHTQQKANAHPTSAPNNNNTMKLPSSPQSPPQPTPTLTKSSASYRPIVNETAILNSNISPHPSLVSSSSSSRSSSASSRPSLSYSSSSSPPPLHLSTSSSIVSAPSSPPPTIPLPPIPPQLSSVSSTTISSKQQKHMQYQYPHYQNKQLQHGSPPMAPLDTNSFGGAVKKGTTVPSLPGTGTSDENIHHGKPFWKSMKTKWRNS